MAYDKQVFYEDVTVGQEIPSLTKIPNQTQLLAWAAAMDDFNPVHQDREIAKNAGYPQPIVFGPLTVSFMIQMVTDWMGPEGWLRKIDVRHGGPQYVNKETVCKGKVRNKYAKDGQYFVELEFQAGDSENEAKTVGTALIILPNKAQANPLPKAEPLYAPYWAPKKR